MVKGRSPLVVECVAWVMSVALEPIFMLLVLVNGKDRASFLIPKPK
jgi:hypothetical protein